MLRHRRPQPDTQTAAKLQELEASLAERDEKLTALLIDREALDDELVRLRAEVAKAKKEAAEHADTHDYSEAETRTHIIDEYLHEAGWPLTDERDREYEVSGMPNQQNTGYVDYVLWGDDGKPLGLVEAKRTTKSPLAGKQQAKLYADCLEEEFGRRPVIFYSNGYQTWIWDDQMYPPREVQGFYTKDELELLIQRRTSRKSLATAEINDAIVERYYQTRAIRRIGEAFENDLERKALLVMATGAGKTRTVIALSDLLMRCNWAKRILFLADRIALVNQAVGAFKTHLPSSSPVNLVTERHGDGRVYVSTYPTMMGLIDEMQEGRRRFGPGHFDLIVIDEAHRSVYQKYRAIFDYFDSLLVGLTATPKDEIDINTYQLFELERGVPTDAYQLDDAIKDGFLVPPIAVSVPIKFQRQGITYKDLSPEEQEKWDALGVGRRRPDTRQGGVICAERVALQRGHGRQGPRAPHDGRPAGRRRRQDRQDDHLRQEPGARRLHRRALRCQLPEVQGCLCTHHPSRRQLRPVTDRRLLESGQGSAHRCLCRHARHRYRCPGCRQSGLLQAGSLQDEVLADGGTWDQAPSGPLRPRGRQEELLHPRLLRQPRVLQLGPGNRRGSPR